MSKMPFFVSPPRTRSSVLFQLMQFYALDKLGMKPLHNHIELFLEFSHNNLFTDLKTGESELGELYPVIKNDGLHIHFVHPPIYRDAVDRNLNKIQVLKQARSAGHHYLIKGTLNVVDTTEEILDFFKDRHFVITKRRNTEQYVLSLLYATSSKLFNAREFNYDRYMEKLHQGVTVDVSTLDKLPKLLHKTKQVYNLANLLNQRGIEYTETYYEDMEDYNQLFDTVSKIYGTTDWLDRLPSNWEELLPIKVEKNYTHCIKNYDSIIEIIRSHIKESGLE